MANVDSPRGFQPVRRLDGTPWNHATNHFRIASGYATKISRGDPVKAVTGGVIQRAAAGDRILGVFYGVEYYDSAGVFTKKRFWPASTVVQTGKEAIAMVVVDKDVVFEAQMDAVIVNPDDIFAAYDTVTALDGDAIGYSKYQLSAATLSAASGQFKVIGFVKRVDNEPALTKAKVECTLNESYFSTEAAI